HHRGLGQENGAMHGCARGHAHGRLWRRADGPDPGALLLPPGGAHRTCHGLGYTLSPCPGMGVFPRAGPGGPGHDARGAGRMSIHIIKVPDLGEGIADVELVAWHVAPGDEVVEDQPLADVMTDKANVEIPSPVAGRVVSLGSEPGQVMAVGADLIHIEIGEASGQTRTSAGEPVSARAAAPASVDAPEESRGHAAVVPEQAPQALQTPDVPDMP